MALTSVTSGFDLSGFELLSKNIDDIYKINKENEIKSIIEKFEAEKAKFNQQEELFIRVNQQLGMSEEEARKFLKSYAQYPAETLGAIVVTNTQTRKQVSEIIRAKIFFSPFSKTLIYGISSSIIQVNSINSFFKIFFGSNLFQ